MNNLLAGFKNVGQQVKMHPRSKAHNDILVYHGFSAPIFKIDLQAHIHPCWVVQRKKKQWPHSQDSNYSEASDWRPSVVWCNMDNIPDSSYCGSNGCLLTHEERALKLEKHGTGHASSDVSWLIHRHLPRSGQLSSKVMWGLRHLGICNRHGFSISYRHSRGFHPKTLLAEKMHTFATWRIKQDFLWDNI